MNFGYKYFMKKFKIWYESDNECHHNWLIRSPILRNLIDKWDMDRHRTYTLEEIIGSDEFELLVYPEDCKDWYDTEEEFKIQKIKLEKQEDDIKNRNNILKKLNSAIDEQKNRLESQKFMLKEQGSTIQTQKKLLIVFIAFIVPEFLNFIYIT